MASITGVRCALLILAAMLAQLLSLAFMASSASPVILIPLLFLLLVALLILFAFLALLVLSAWLALLASLLLLHSSVFGITGASATIVMLMFLTVLDLARPRPVALASTPPVTLRAVRVASRGAGCRCPASPPHPAGAKGEKKPKGEKKA